MNDIYPYNPHNLKYDYFYRLFKNYERFKKPYLRRCNESFERNGKRLGIFRYIPQNKRYGIVNEYGLWCWRNSINTHPYCLLDLYYLYKEFKKDFDKIINAANSSISIFKLEINDYEKENIKLKKITNLKDIVFYNSNHKFRLKNGFGALDLEQQLVLFDKEFNAKYMTIDILDFENEKVRLFKETDFYNNL